MVLSKIFSILFLCIWTADSTFYFLGAYLHCAPKIKKSARRLPRQTNVYSAKLIVDHAHAGCCTTHNTQHTFGSHQIVIIINYFYKKK